MINQSADNLPKAIKTLDPSKTNRQATSEAEILIQFVEEREKAKKKEKIFSLLILFLLLVVVIMTIIGQMDGFS
jgi:cell division protein FtsL